jgi:hypothetical protein
MIYQPPPEEMKPVSASWIGASVFETAVLKSPPVNAAAWVGEANTDTNDSTATSIRVIRVFKGPALQALVN